MNKKTAKLLRKYAAMHVPEGSQEILQGKTVSFSGRMSFYKNLKREYYSNKSIKQLIEKEMEC